MTVNLCSDVKSEDLRWCESVCLVCSSILGVQQSYLKVTVFVHGTAEALMAPQTPPHPPPPSTHSTPSAPDTLADALFGIAKLP